jgi:glycerol-1-phosphate dehydrogenase [NAD(P)+]
MNPESRKLHSEKLYFDPEWKPPRTVYGSNLIGQATEKGGNYALVTMEIPYNLVRDSLKHKPAAVVYVPNMHLQTMVDIEKTVPDDIEMVIGLGGGSSHDCAKYIALKKNIRLVQFPTIFGGDAVVTTAVGIRDEGRVRYIGHVNTDTIYIDFDLLRKAPPVLVRYGAADILSSYTGLLDWKLASDRGKETYNREIAEYAQQELLARLYDNAGEIRDMSEQGIRTIVELYLEYHRISHLIATDRAQEGSEHFFAYNAEYVTKRTFVHGALLSLGIWISAGFFYERKDEIEEILGSLGLRHSLISAGISEGELVTVLKTLQDFVVSGGYYYSIVHEKGVDDAMVSDIVSAVKKLR